MTQLPRPIFNYRFEKDREDSPSDCSWRYTRGPGRWISRGGRDALYFAELHAGFALLEHTLNSPRGAAGIWLTPLDDLASHVQLEQHRLHNPGFDHYIFLSDREAILDPMPAQFALYFHTHWHPVFLAKWHRGDYRELWSSPHRFALALAGHLRLPRDSWHHLCCVWDRPAGDYGLFVNGVKVGGHDTTYDGVLAHQPAGPAIYGGAPRIGYGAVSFYDEALSAEQIEAIVAEGDYPVDEENRRELLRVHAGAGLQTFHPPDLDIAGWQKQLDLSMREPADLLAFYHQGANNGTKVTPEGVRVTTPEMEDYIRDRHPRGGEQTRMYLLTRKTFEGDLYVRFTFRSHRRGGLCLLMTQAAGMHGEDFLHTYHPRTNGSMSMVHREDVRNYHWEFYREMIDIRNDVINHAIVKNPWHRPLAYQVVNDRWELERSYCIHFLQRGNRIVGAVDDTVVFDVEDSSWQSTGPVLRHGAIALRCMMRTDATFSDLKVFTR